MIIGILQTDSVITEFSDLFGEYPAMFQSLFKQIDPTIKFNIYDVQHGVYPNNIHECNAYVSTGSKASVYDTDPWIKIFQNFIIQLDEQHKKHVAICFAHQLIAQAFNGKTEKSQKGWGVGVHTSQIQKHKDWMRPSLPAYNLIVSHQDQVVTLPAGAELLAGSSFCPNAMFQKGENILAIQGHPEFNKHYSKALMQHRSNILGKATLKKGIDSLQKETHELTIAKWMLQFMQDQ